MILIQEGTRSSKINYSSCKSWVDANFFINDADVGRVDIDDKTNFNISDYFTTDANDDVDASIFIIENEDTSKYIGTLTEG